MLSRSEEWRKSRFAWRTWFFFFFFLGKITLTRVPHRGFPWKNFKGVWSSLSSSSPVPMAYMSAIACTHGAHFNDFHAPYVPRTYMISLSLESARVC
jgi:hypothetical protein